MVNYFKHFGLDWQFDLDLVELKKKFLIKSRELHPDFHTDKSESEQEAILAKSSYNNSAFKVLKNPYSRFKYLLTLHKVDFEESKQSLPQMFLMEMMDFNEKLMDAQMESDQSQISSLIKELEKIEKSLFSGVSSILKGYKPDEITESELISLQEYYFKKKYLLRIRENLDRFASS
ncbi:UNVERIFIED_CONTAM: hypothetical protein GTU68_009151 [Idotea baltica]|nr:hypothetical protein [Idotea baltica]